MQISSGGWPVFSCFFHAVLLPYPHPRGKDPFLPVISLRSHNLLSVSADAMQDDIAKPSVPLPYNDARGPIKQKNTKSHSANTLSGDILIFVHLKSTAVEIQTLYTVSSSGSASLQGKLFYWVCIGVNTENAKGHVKAGIIRKYKRLWCYRSGSLAVRFISMEVSCHWVNVYTVG